MKPKIQPNARQRHLNEQDFIVSKTDITGRITYANRIFMDICGYSEAQLLHQQHNIIRHPDMPRGVFKFMWDTLKAGEEFFGFAKNLCADGAYYWVFANITPDYDRDGQLRGYYSVRRYPPSNALAVLTPVYQHMLLLEQQVSPAEAPFKSVAYLQEVVKNSGAKSYNHLVLDLYKPKGI